MLILKNGKLIRKKDNKLNKSNNESSTNKLNSIISKAKSSKYDFWNFIYDVWNKINDKNTVDETHDDEVVQTQKTVIEPAISATKVALRGQRQLSGK